MRSSMMSARGKAALLIPATLAVLFARRPDQFLHPYLWVEEGLYVLPAFAASGWRAATMSLSGYLLIASTFLDVLAFKASIAWSPEIAAAFAAAFTCAVVVAVALSPTLLRWRFACAIAVLLVPTNPEVFGTAIYAFWWAGILLLLAVLWDEGLEPLRWAYLVVGGLSSPLIGPTAMLLGLRAVVDRTRPAVLAALVAAACAAVQGGMMLSWIVVGHSLAVPPSLSLPTLIISQFAGAFFHGGLYVGLGVAAVIAIAGIAVRRRLGYGFLLLAMLVAAVDLSVVLRLPPEQMAAMTPGYYGPRYFFYPFILLSWIMIQIAAVASWPVRAAVGAGFAAALTVAAPSLSTRADPLDWRAELAACVASETYELPIQYVGTAAQLWHLKLTGEQCRALIDRSWF